MYFFTVVLQYSTVSLELREKPQCRKKRLIDKEKAAQTDFLQKTTQTKQANFFSLPLLVDKDATSINIRDKKNTQKNNVGGLSNELFEI